MPIVTPSGVGNKVVTLRTGNGNGSAAPMIRRYTTVVESVGITYADSATQGMSCTIIEPGIYTIAVCDRSVNVDLADHGISVNSAQLTTPIDGITTATRLAFGMTAGSPYYCYCSWTGKLDAGDVIRQHGQGSGDTNAFASFTIRKVGNV